MIKPTPALLLFASLAIPASSFSQEAPRQRPSARSAVAESAPAAHRSAVAATLQKNITISLSGALGDGSPVDIALTGCGREFRSEVILGKTEIAGNAVPTIGSLTFRVEQNDGAYFVTYEIGARLAVATASTAVAGGGAATRTSIGFEDVMVTGMARCDVGKKVTIFKAGDQQGMHLTVTEP